jgi:hypothetical protein
MKETIPNRRQRTGLQGPVYSIMRDRKTRSGWGSPDAASRWRGYRDGKATSASGLVSELIPDPAAWRWHRLAYTRPVCLPDAKPKTGGRGERRIDSMPVHAVRLKRRKPVACTERNGAARIDARSGRSVVQAGAGTGGRVAVCLELDRSGRVWPPPKACSSPSCRRSDSGAWTKCRGKLLGSDRGPGRSDSGGHQAGFTAGSAADGAESLSRRSAPHRCCRRGHAGRNLCY